MGCNLALEFLAKQTFFEGLSKIPLAPGALPTAVSLAASFTVLFVVTWMTRDREDLDPDVKKVMDL